MCSRVKKTFLVILIITLVACLSGCKHNDVIIDAPSIPAASSLAVRGVWLPYYELQEWTQTNDEAAFSEVVDAAFQELAKWRFNTVTVHVRPCADAFYRSSLFPSSQYCFGEQGSEMPYDPLSVLCEAAHRYHLKLEAWVNPYRVSQNSDMEALCDSNLAKKWYSADDTKSRVYVAENGIYFNPAGEGVTDLIVSGVKEIVTQYDVDAIHFDDYFYPTAEEGIDADEYRQYVDNGGDLSLFDFRRDVVSKMIKSVYSAVKSIDSAVLFGVSPASNMDDDYHKLYADVVTWMTEKGYVDYIVPQIYFGFQNEVQPFMRTVKKWSAAAQCPLYVGLPLYKCGKEDAYASKTNDDAINEFVINHNMIARQITYLSKLDNVKGFYLFSYGSLHSERCAEEVSNLLQAFPDSNQAQRRIPAGEQAFPSQ